MPRETKSVDYVSEHNLLIIENRQSRVCLVFYDLSEIVDASTYILKVL